MNKLLEKIPRPILVIVILVAALVFFIYNDPPKDECEIQTEVFTQNTAGLLSSTKKNKKTQFAQIYSMRDRCKQGNSMGTCAEYFTGLSKIAKALNELKESCQLKYAEDDENFSKFLSQSLQVMSLVAWGEKPPAGISERSAWLSEANLRTFCTLKRSYLLVAGEESYGAIRSQIFAEYPDAWPDYMVPNEKSDVDLRRPEERPRALKTATNPKGSFSVSQIYERSLFSLRCDLYL